ncbi:universal stress protein [Leifsonia sp. NPDC058248]|uniref:universal stress protein n=1 Tax=Leifsonia sp. NPDC058248 TaxID=3346402 RepID=UPI0036DBB4FF
MTEKTVVGWDGSAKADVALDWAVDRERARHGALDVIVVVDEGLFIGDDDAFERAFDVQERKLEGAIARVRGQAPDVEIRSAILRGDPTDLLAAQTGPGTLLVVGTRRRTGPRARFGWSLGARLAAASAGPVAIVPELGTDEPRRVGVVVGIDGSHVGDRALDFAAREASRRGEPLTIVHAWLEPLAWQPEAMPDDDFVESIQAARREMLDDRVRRTAEHHVGITIESVLVRGEPVIALRDASGAASALVVGSRRLGNWKRAWLGSVSHGVILDMVSPVIVIGPETETAHHD